jgi:hypothetical protein
VFDVQLLSSLYSKKERTRHSGECDSKNFCLNCYFILTVQYTMIILLLIRFALVRCICEDVLRIKSCEVWRVALESSVPPDFRSGRLVNFATSLSLSSSLSLSLSLSLIHTLSLSLSLSPSFSLSMAPFGTDTLPTNRFVSAMPLWIENEREDRERGRKKKKKKKMQLLWEESFELDWATNHKVRRHLAIHRVALSIRFVLLVLLVM